MHRKLLVYTHLEIMAFYQPLLARILLIIVIEVQINN